MDNLNIYEQSREVPKEAQKRIKGGRLSGMTDINPMWRIKKLTDLFGPVGFGWRYEIIDKRLEEGGNNEIAAFVDINLYVKYEGEWSEAIQGTGGSTFVAKESRGLHTSDECFKMALTDAISIACKALGFGADIYWDKDTTKYSKKKKSGGNNQSSSSSKSKMPSKKQLVALKDWLDEGGKGKEILVNYLKKRDCHNLKELTSKQAENLLKKLNKEVS